MQFWDYVDKGLDKVNRRTLYFKEKKEKFLIKYKDLNLEELRERYRRAEGSPEKVAIINLIHQQEERISE